MVTKKTSSTAVTYTAPHTLRITIDASASESKKARETLLKNLEKNVSVPGFRPGVKIPEATLLRHVGAQRFQEMLIQEIVEAKIPEMTRQENIHLVGNVRVVETLSESPVQVVVEAEVLPKIEIDEKKLKKISIKATKVESSDDDVEKEIAQMTRQMTHYHHAGEHTEDGADTSNAKAEMGDRVTVDAQGYEKKGGVPIPATKVTGHGLVLGSKQFIPGFEEELVGAEKGAVVDFDITFPKDYHSDDFKGKKVHFVVTILEVEKAHTPEWDEDTIERVSGVREDFTAFKKRLKDMMSKEKEREARTRDEGKLLEQLLEITPVEPGPLLIERQCEIVAREQEERMQEQGFKLKDYLTHTHQTREQYIDAVVKPEATRRLKSELLLGAIRDARDVSASDSDIEKELDEVLSHMPAEQKAKLRERLKPKTQQYEEIRLRLTFRQIVDGFFEKQ